MGKVTVSMECVYLTVYRPECSEEAENWDGRHLPQKPKSSSINWLSEGHSESVVAEKICSLHAFVRLETSIVINARY